VPGRDSRAVPWLKLAASAALVVACVVAVDARSVVRELCAVDARWLGAALGLHLVQVGLLGLRWAAIARALGLRLGVRRAVSEYALSIFMNQVLPGGVAGDGLRAVRHARWAPGTSVLRALEALATDRASGQLALWAAVLATAPLAVAHRIVEPQSLALGIAGTALAAGTLWLLVDRLAPRAGALSRLRRSLRRVGSILLHPRHVVLHLPLSFAFVAITLLQLQVAAQALGSPLALDQLVFVGPLILCAAAVPSFFGGWGIREGASAVLFAAAGLPGSRGLAVSVVYGVFALSASAVGLLVFWFLERSSAGVSRPPAQDAAETSNMAG
jgi:uncharacterized membrane protein YbhN (UPF0104 family)